MRHAVYGTCAHTCRPVQSFWLQHGYDTGSDVWQANLILSFGGIAEVQFTNQVQQHFIGIISAILNIPSNRVEVSSINGITYNRR